MSPSQSSVTLLGHLLRNTRIQRGWTQLELAQRAGYSERVIRKAEQGGRVRYQFARDIADCLSLPENPIELSQLLFDPIQVAKLWMETFDLRGREMLDILFPYLAEDMVFVCAGGAEVFPFDGTFYGIEGHQKWLDAFFGIFTRVPGIAPQYSTGENSASARWLESVYIQGVLCPPVRVHLHFFFRDGLVYRIEDDYDTLSGYQAKEASEAYLRGDTRFIDELWKKAKKLRE